MDYDFSGYATKNNIRCADGRVIRHDAFKENDGQIVPLVWQHVHDDPTNVLGHALLENRDDGVYAYATLNNTESGKHAREMVKNGDIVAMSIFANRLQQHGSDVIHGVIREVSLVLAGANPGALIDNISLAHADGSYTDIDDEAVIYSGLEGIEYFSHADDSDEEESEESDDKKKEGGMADKTIQDVFNTLND
jgi:HK97 family phage prohead protease